MFTITVCNCLTIDTPGFVKKSTSFTSTLFVTDRKYRKMLKINIICSDLYWTEKNILDENNSFDLN